MKDVLRPDLGVASAGQKAISVFKRSSARNERSQAIGRFKDVELEQLFPWTCGRLVCSLVGWLVRGQRSPTTPRTPGTVFLESTRAKKVMSVGWLVG
jgi:hypothetical protein